MTAHRQIRFRIRRCKPGVIDPPRFQTYALRVTRHMSVLDSLEQIRLEQDSSLMYRHSCHHASCGTCACIINGIERLACTTTVWDLEDPTVTLEPLNGFPVIGDLAVDPEPLFQDLDAAWSYRRPADSATTVNDPDAGEPLRFENCIECGACLSVCPVAQEAGGFLGPAALAAIHREMTKSPEKADALLSLAGGRRGEKWCRRALGCSRVCPAAVYPARHIADLRRAVADRKKPTRQK